MWASVFSFLLFPLYSAFCTHPYSTPFLPRLFIPSSPPSPLLDAGETLSCIPKEPPPVSPQQPSTGWLASQSLLDAQETWHVLLSIAANRSFRNYVTEWIDCRMENGSFYTTEHCTVA
jgi:hypothetical protein